MTRDSSSTFAEVVQRRPANTDATSRPSRPALRYGRSLEDPNYSNSNNNEVPIQMMTSKLHKMMDIERHHIISISQFDAHDLDLFHTWVDWCPRYEAVSGAARGGKALLHHVCRRCRKVCFHLLDRTDGVRQRICLGCWERCPDPRLIPRWYYHDDNAGSGCRFCRKQQPERKRSRPRLTRDSRK